MASHPRPRSRHMKRVTSPRPRFTLVSVEAGADGAAFIQDVRAGLTRRPKRLSCFYFYDREGSRLFEEICELPEYYLPRAEREILQKHAAEVVSRLPANVTLVELGSGNAAKTRILIEALLGLQKALRYVPVDICRPVLEESSLRLVEDYPSLDILAVAGEYHE